MTNEQKRYIEDNINLIENDKWEEFFKNAPWGTGAAVHEAGIDFLQYMSSVPQHVFWRSRIKTIRIPAATKIIEEGAFSNCTELEEIHISNSVTNIDKSALMDCTSLQSVTFDEDSQLTNISSYCFCYCSSLKSIRLPDSLLRIGDYAFSGCASLTTIDVPDGVTSIEECAFHECTALTTISLPDSIKLIGDSAFEGCGKLTINYSGTIDEWKQLIVNNSRVFKNTTYTCKCTDGIVKKSR